MAILTVGRGDYIRPYRNARVVHYPEAASQTFKIGDPLILATASDKGHECKISGSDPTTGIIGFAAAAASGTEGTLIPIWIADGRQEFLGRVQDTGTLDYDLTGASYGLVADATNLIWRVDLTETTTTFCQVIKLVDAHGDVNGRLVFKIPATAAARQAFK